MNSNSAKSETCQVAIFNEPNQTLEIRHESIPVITDDELLVKVNACTICGSDLHTITGKRKEDTPTIMMTPLAELEQCQRTTIQLRVCNTSGGGLPGIQHSATPQESR